MIFSPFERMVALRYLGARRGEGFVSVIAGFTFAGIALGVAALIVVVAVMNGFRHELMARVLALNGHLEVQALNGRLTGYAVLADRLRAIDAVARVTPRIDGHAMATANGVATGALLRGFRLADLRARDIVAGNIRAGGLDRFTGKSVVAIGARLAEKLGVGVGDRVTLISPQTTHSAFGPVPRQKRYRVVAIFEVGLAQYDDTLVYMPLAAAQLFLRLPGAVGALEIELRDASAIEAGRRAVAGVAGRDVWVIESLARFGPFLDWVRVQRNVLSLVLGLMIVVAAFNIVSGLNMMVKDKRRDIGILRTLGATRGAIMRVFLLHSLAVAVAGTATGIGLAVVVADQLEAIRQWLGAAFGVDLFSPDIYFLAELPARIQVADVAWVSAMALGAAFLATLYPSWRAAAVDPVETLRYG